MPIYQAPLSTGGNPYDDQKMNIVQITTAHQRQEDDTHILAY